VTGRRTARKKGEARNSSHFFHVMGEGFAVLGVVFGVKSGGWVGGLENEKTRGHRLERSHCVKIREGGGHEEHGKLTKGEGMVRGTLRDTLVSLANTKGESGSSRQVEFIGHVVILSSDCSCKEEILGPWCRGGLRFRIRESGATRGVLRRLRLMGKRGLVSRTPPPSIL